MSGHMSARPGLNSPQAAGSGPGGRGRMCPGAGLHSASGECIGPSAAALSTVGADQGPLAFQVTTVAWPAVS